MRSCSASHNARRRSRAVAERQAASEILSLGKGTLSAGVDADVIIFDPDKKWVLRKNLIFSKSKNSPWIDKELIGKVTKTLVKGRVIYDGENILNPENESDIIASPGCS